MLKIMSKTDGFWRCGVSHPSTPTEYSDDKFSAKELKILKAEPMLVVEVLAANDAGNKPSQDDIVQAINKLDLMNGELLTGDGKPQVSAIEAILDQSISAKDRDAAWDEINKLKN